MRINTQQRQQTVPFSDGRGHFYTAFTHVWAPAKQLPDKANCGESIVITSQGLIQDLWKGGGGAAATASAGGAKVFGGSRLKTLFGISKGGRAPPAPPLNPLVLPFQISAIHRTIFLPTLILTRIYSLSSYTWSSFRSSRLVPYGTYVRISTRTLVATVSSHARIISDSSCLICMFYGRVQG